MQTNKICDFTSMTFISFAIAFMKQVTPTHHLPQIKVIIRNWNFTYMSFIYQADNRPSFAWLNKFTMTLLNKTLIIYYACHIKSIKYAKIMNNKVYIYIDLL